jgi:hypothetical protein
VELGVCGTCCSDSLESFCHDRHGLRAMYIQLYLSLSVVSSTLRNVDPLDIGSLCNALTSIIIYSIMQFFCWLAGVFPYIYVISRMVLLLLTIYCFKSMPIWVYRTVGWINYFPFFS